MVSLDDAVIVRLKTYGENFEIFVDPDLALAYRSGESVKLEGVLAVENIFKDANAGDKASEEVMGKIFGSSDVKIVADVILKKGELHLTTEQKRRMLEDRKKQIITIISQNAINPQTKSPHPPARIDKAMVEARVDVTISKSAKEQVDGVVRALQPILPIRFEKLNIAVNIPAAYTGKMYNVLREFGEVRKEEWVSGEQYCMLEIPAGLRDEFYSRLNNLTHGEVKIKVL